METPPETNLMQPDATTLHLGGTSEGEGEWEREKEGKLEHARPLRVSLTCVQLSATLVYLTSPLQRPTSDGSTAWMTAWIVFVSDG